MHVFPDQGMKNIYEDILDEQSQHVDTLLPKSAALGLIKKKKFQESAEKRNPEIIEENTNDFGSRNMKAQKSSWGHCVRCHKGPFCKLLSIEIETNKSSAATRNLVSCHIQVVTWC